MTQIEQIKAEIESNIKAFDNSGIYDAYEAGELAAYQELLSFIDSLEKENRGNFPKSNTNSSKIKGWVARDSKGFLFFSKENPKERIVHHLALLDDLFFPDIKFSDEPIEVELEIHRV